MTSLGCECLTSMVQDWNASEALVVAGSLPLAQTDQHALRNSSDEEVRFYSCRLEQKMLQELSCSFHALPGVCKLWGKKPCMV